MENPVSYRAVPFDVTLQAFRAAFRKATEYTNSPTLLSVGFSFASVRTTVFRLFWDSVWAGELVILDSRGSWQKRKQAKARNTCFTAIRLDRSSGTGETGCLMQEPQFAAGML